jgi:hypothetical protein
LCQERELDKARLVNQADAQLHSSKQYAKHLIDEVAGLKERNAELEEQLGTWKKRARAWGRACSGCSGTMAAATRSSGT